MATPPPNEWPATRATSPLFHRVEEPADPGGVAGEGALLGRQLGGPPEPGQGRGVDPAAGRGHGPDGRPVGVGPQPPAVEEQRSRSGADTRRSGPGVPSTSTRSHRIPGLARAGACHSSGPATTRSPGPCTSPGMAGQCTPDRASTGLIIPGASPGSSPPGPPGGRLRTRPGATPAPGPGGYASSIDLHEAGTAEPWHRTRTRPPPGEPASTGGTSPSPGTPGGGIGAERQGPEPGPEPAGQRQGPDRQGGQGHRGQQDRRARRARRHRWQQAQARGPTRSPAPQAQAVRGHDGLGRGGPGGGHHRGAGHREGRRRATPTTPTPR